MSWYWHINTLYKVKKVLLLDIFESDGDTEDYCYLTFNFLQRSINEERSRKKHGFIATKYIKNKDVYFVIKQDMHMIQNFDSSTLKTFNEEKEKLLKKGFLLTDSLKKVVNIKWSNDPHELWKKFLPWFSFIFS